MATLIRPGQPPKLLWPETPPLFTVEELHEALGGYIEILGRLELHPGEGWQWALCNEDGKRLQLAPNEFATYLLRAYGLCPPADVVVGPLILCEPSEID